MLVMSGDETFEAKLLRGGGLVGPGPRFSSLSFPLFLSLNVQPFFLVQLWSKVQNIFLFISFIVFVYFNCCQNLWNCKLIIIVFLYFKKEWVVFVYFNKCQNLWNCELIIIIMFLFYFLEEWVVYYIQRSRLHLACFFFSSNQLIKKNCLNSTLLFHFHFLSHATSPPPLLLSRCHCHGP